MVFRTKFVNDDYYERNGEEVKIIREIDRYFVEIEFKDGTRATVYKSEVHNND